MKRNICDEHKKEMLHFLLVKTAAVRNGVKPGEFLRLQKCYRLRSRGARGICLYQEEILAELQLDFKLLKDDVNGSLVIFFNREALSALLHEDEVAKFLAVEGYADCRTVDDYLERLKEHFAVEKLPHEIGIFIGYPLKDVKGFINNEARTHVPGGRWQVFGDASPSVELMSRYCHIEGLAGEVCKLTDNLEQCMKKISMLNINMKEYMKCPA